MSQTPASMKIDIPGVNFEEMAREAIAARLTEALVGANDSITKIVAAALSQKVNDKGVVGSSYENRIPFVEWLAHDLIRQTVVEVLKAKIDAMRPSLQKAIEAELKNTVKGTAKALVNAFASQATSTWGLKVEVRPIER